MVGAGSDCGGGCNRVWDIGGLFGCTYPYGAVEGDKIKWREQGRGCVGQVSQASKEVFDFLEEVM